ncbi:cysteine-rich receptor-like protein kinase 19 [Pyrus ussuriensis x Pyrus communis]|uniref:Cysteine-rich receptor-like protein kinase 19 n=1 Tax=Pyrus ussuriensis x Pyrus communis TaxID=2448454 RepID=A0A5N5GU25_9ROSA|nr:cysteine-rich receptor-like protein kinase 19 [Pyrus ussuriensis x Pyrus communis]
MVSKFLVLPFFFFFHIFFAFRFQPSEAQSWIKAAYWYSGSEFPISDINSPLFTHLIYAYTDVNSSSYELSSFSSDPSEQYYSTFTPTVKLKNPSVTTLVSIGGGNADYGVFSTMVSSSSHRKSFIDSSIIFARRYGFLGLDFSTKNSQTPLILTAAVQYKPDFEYFAFPVESIRDNLNWVHVIAYDYHGPWTNFTGAHAALYDTSSDWNTDYGIKSWIGRGLSASKLVLGLPFYGYAWTLSNPRDSAIGAPAKGPAITKDGSMSYKDIKGYTDRYGADIVYNATYVAKYCVIDSAWIGFDDAEEQNLLGYYIWQVSHDDNWVLSLAAAAQEGGGSGQNKRRLLVIVLTTIASVILVLGSALSYFRMRLHKSKAKESESRANDIADTAGKFNSNVPNLKIFSNADVGAATGGFSIENKLGEGGYGPVYKGVLPDGQEIAVKKLSKASTQGFEEFKNEVMLTAKLQHVNLVRVLGFCIEHHEQMLIYEYMPKKSLDLYLFDPVRRYELDWRKRVQIIEGVTQGLLYLQEYSRLTIIHRDLKASNILLDEEMRPKISDFGMARIFAKDELEANTGRIVGTYGYVPPEYIKKGLYSTKSDVYSFGVLLLQIISGKKNAPYYGSDEDLNLLEYAYLLWKQGQGMEFMDLALDDTHSLCKLMRCLQIALLCVQENANDRPSMLEISSMLQNEGATMENPKIPAFSKRNEDEETNPTPRPEACSINDATISEVVAR